MKKVLLSCALVLGLTMPLPSPSHAIFGLSTCEKVKKQILNEEQVGVVLHKKYLTQRKVLLSMNRPTWNNLNDVLSWLPDVYDSDLRVYNLVNKNSSCFSTNQIARARSDTRQSKKDIKDIDTLRSMLLKKSIAGEKALERDQISFLQNLYSNYHSFLTNKKLSR